MPGYHRSHHKGEKDADRLADLCQGKLWAKKEQMHQAVQGRLTHSDAEQLKMLKEDLTHYEKQLNRIESKIEAIEQAHYAEHTELLKKISGVGPMSSQQIIGEIGVDMDKFATPDHLTSWAGLCPGNHESGGKRKNTSTRKGNKHLRTVMVSVAWAAVRTKHSYWSYQFAYLKSRMPAKKAIVAIARKMLKLIYNTLNEKRQYEEGGRRLFKQVQRNKQLARMQKQVA